MQLIFVDAAPLLRVVVIVVLFVSSHADTFFLKHVILSYRFLKKNRVRITHAISVLCGSNLKFK